MIIFQDEFEKSKGQPIVYKGKTVRMYDSFPVPIGECRLRFRFISTKSEWKQGVGLKTEGFFVVRGVKFKKPLCLWEHTAPKQDVIVCKSEDGIVEVVNKWENSRGGVDYWYNGAAMTTEEIKNGRRYHCNDGHPDDDFTDLIFELIREEEVPKLEKDGKRKSSEK